jgi:Sin3 binding region of histone deacetylase complex subunit SAP30
MDLKDLHSYRHAYRLNTSGSQTNPQAHLFLANAARQGIYSPSVVAARRKQRQLKKRSKETATGPKERSSSRLKGAASNANNISSMDFEDSGRQTKEQLATAVRKHFNAMSVSEGEVVARFTYVVRHIAASMTDADEDKGFRMRFKP